MDFTAVINSIRTALYGSEVRESIASGMEWVKKFADSASDQAALAVNQAAAAKKSADAAQASETNAKASETASKTSETNAARFKTVAENSAAEAKKEADRAALIAANAYVYAYDLTLSKSGWAATTETDALAVGLNYQEDILIADCTERLEPSATVSMASTAAAQKCGLGVVCESRAGAVRFWAATVPESDIALRLLLINRNPNQEG